MSGLGSSGSSSGHNTSGSGFSGPSSSRSYEDLAASWDKTAAKTGSTTGPGIGGSGYQGGDLAGLGGYYGGVTGSGSWGESNSGQSSATYDPNTGSWVVTPVQTPVQKMVAEGYTELKTGKHVGGYLSPDGETLKDATGKTIGKASPFGGFMTAAGAWRVDDQFSSVLDMAALNDPRSKYHNIYTAARAEQNKKASEAAAAQHLSDLHKYMYDTHGVVASLNPEAARKQARIAVNQAKLAGVEPNSMDLEVALGGFEDVDQPTRDREYFTGLVNEQIQSERGVLGSLFDTLTGRETEVDPEGYSRALSPEAAEKLAKSGRLGAAMRGLSQGLLQTDSSGNITDDKWGQFIEVADSALSMAALPLAPLFVGGNFGEALGRAGVSAAGQAMTPGLPTAATAKELAEMDILGAVASMTGAAEPLVDAYNIAKLREEAGIVSPPRTSPVSSLFTDIEGDTKVILPSTSQETPRVSTTQSDSSSDVSSETRVSPATGISSYFVRPQLAYNPYMYSPYAGLQSFYI